MQSPDNHNIVGESDFYFSGGGVVAIIKSALADLRAQDSEILATDVRESRDGEVVVSLTLESSSFATAESKMREVASYLSQCVANETDDSHGSIEQGMTQFEFAG